MVFDINVIAHTRNHDIREAIRVVDGPGHFGFEINQLLFGHHRRSNRPVQAKADLTIRGRTIVVDGVLLDGELEELLVLQIAQREFGFAGGSRNTHGVRKIFQTNVDVLVRISSHLKLDVTHASTHITACAFGANFSAVEHVHTIPLRIGRNSRNFSVELLVLCIERVTVSTGIGVVARLHCKLAHAVEKPIDFTKSAFGGLEHGDTIVGIAHGLVQTTNLHGTRITHRQSGSVILCTVDTLTRGQLLHRTAERAIVHHHVVLNDDGFVICIDHCHRPTPTCSSMADDGTKKPGARPGSRSLAVATLAPAMAPDQSITGAATGQSAAAGWLAPTWPYQLAG